MDTPRTPRWALAALAAPVLLAACGDSTETPAAAPGVPATAPLPVASPIEARTTLTTADGAKVGEVTFSQVSGAPEVEVVLSANKAVVADQFHGIHVHANDMPANGEGCTADPAMAPSTWFTTVDGHLKAVGATHAEHTGDFPSLLVRKDGTAGLTFTTDRFTAAEVVGKAVIVHASPDNFGNIPVGPMPDQYTSNGAAAATKTDDTGNAGDRMACGLITRG